MNQALPLMDFDQEGSWVPETHSSPAIHTPEDIKAICNNTFRVKWLNMSDTNEDLFAKNHMIAVLSFEMDEKIAGKTYEVHGAWG